MNNSLAKDVPCAAVEFTASPLAEIGQRRFEIEGRPKMSDKHRAEKQISVPGGAHEKNRNNQIQRSEGPQAPVRAGGRC